MDTFGDKRDLQKIISENTGIRENFLERPDEASSASVAQKMSWVAKRKTTRVEDRACCSLGLLDINMPLLYGEMLNEWQLELKLVGKATMLHGEVV